MEISIIISLIIVLLILFSEYLNQSKEAKKCKENWRFCKKLLDNTRSVLTDSQKEEVDSINMKMKR